LGGSQMRAARLPARRLATRTCRASTTPNHCRPSLGQSHATTGRYVLTLFLLVRYAAASPHGLPCRVLNQGSRLRSYVHGPSGSSVSVPWSGLPLSAEPRCRALGVPHLNKTLPPPVGGDTGRPGHRPVHVGFVIG
jgi:hypothetical protein